MDDRASLSPGWRRAFGVAVAIAVAGALAVGALHTPLLRSATLACPFSTHPAHVAAR